MGKVIDRLSVKGIPTIAYNGRVIHPPPPHRLGACELQLLG